MGGMPELQNWEDAERTAARLIAASPSARRKCSTASQAIAEAQRILASADAEPQPEGPQESGPDYGFDDSAHLRLLNLFLAYNVDHLPMAVSMVKQFRGHESSLLNAWVRRLGPEPGTSGAQPRPMAMPLVDGWREIRGRRGHVYYRHDDGRKQWVRPVDEKISPRASRRPPELVPVDRRPTTQSLIPPPPMQSTNTLNRSPPPLPLQPLSSTLSASPADVAGVWVYSDAEDQLTPDVVTNPQWAFRNCVCFHLRVGPKGITGHTTHMAQPTGSTLTCVVRGGAVSISENAGAGNRHIYKGTLDDGTIVGGWSAETGEAGEFTLYRIARAWQVLSK